MGSKKIASFSERLALLGCEGQHDPQLRSFQTDRNELRSHGSLFCHDLKTNLGKIITKNTCTKTNIASNTFEKSPVEFSLAKQVAKKKKLNELANMLLSSRSAANLENTLEIEYGQFNELVLEL